MLVTFNSREIVFQFGELLRFVLVLERDESLVENDGEHDEKQKNRNENRSDDDGRGLADDAETHPREQNDLAEEKQDSETGGEDPRQLDEDPESRVRGIPYFRFAV